MRALLSRTLCSKADVLRPVAARTCRESVRSDMQNSAANAETPGGSGKADSKRDTSFAINSLPFGEHGGNDELCLGLPAID